MTSIRAREYRRLSKDRGGSSIAEQAQDNAQAAAEQGWELGEAYEDADRSASRYKTRERDGFDRLLADLRAGRFGASVLVIWESSRGSRDVGEWDALVKLCEKHRVLIHVTSHRRTYDPRNHRDRRTLLEDAVDSAYESDKNAVRIRRQTASHAAKGRPHGLAPYGFRPVYDEKTGDLDTWLENHDESYVPVELFRLLEAGHSLAAIARTFAERGWVNAKTGRPFTRHHLRNMATRAAYAGIRVHTDPETGKVTETEGTWDGLVPKEQFYAVRRLLADPARRTTRNGAAKYELTLTIKCDVCGEGLTVTRANLKSKRESYKCRHSHVFISKADVDAIVIPALLSYLARRDIYQQLAAPDSDDEQIRKVRGQLAQARASMAEMEAETPESADHARVLGRSITALAGKISDLEQEEQTLAMPAVITSLLGAADDVAGWWTAAPVSARRQIARIVLSPKLLGEIRVTRTPSKGRTPDVADRLKIRSI
ncbi:recombinase family protein [Streptomyces sp. NBC_00885]|uniref:recombinase family protein n=1 Tax=Streptomyces sp. NBC_00885 TaxID=2975857 RepID=UPI00386AF4D6|nr:recombinase family protein [Streptomyces sp. NBC_00885]